jgi:hypothetical protein
MDVEDVEYYVVSNIQTLSSVLGDSHISDDDDDDDDNDDDNDNDKQASF